MAFCVYYRFKILAIETHDLEVDEGVAARYPPTLQPTSAVPVPPGVRNQTL